MLVALLVGLAAAAAVAPVAPVAPVALVAPVAPAGVVAQLIGFVYALLVEPLVLVG